MRYQSIHKQYQKKLVDYMWLRYRSLLQSFRLFFVQYLVLNSRVKGNLPQNVALMNHNIMQ